LISWGSLLEEWRAHIQDVDCDFLRPDCVQNIFKHARLTSSGKNFVHYEILRKLGSRILAKHTPSNPDSEDEKYQCLLKDLLEGLHDIKRPEYRAWFGCRCQGKVCRGSSGESCNIDSKWTTVRLRKEIGEMLGISLKSLEHERQLGFILALVKSERYTAAEMNTIIKVSPCQLRACDMDLPSLT
jgi:hypothetical protein